MKLLALEVLPFTKQSQIKMKNRKIHRKSLNKGNKAGFLNRYP